MVFPPSLQLEVEGLRVGVFGVMVPMVTSAMKTAAASSYLWTQPIEEARKQVAELRNKVDLVIALTHIGHARDRELAEQVPGIDLILGGHSHTVLVEPVLVGTTWIAQTGSHGRHAGVYEVRPGSVRGGLHRLGSEGPQTD